MTYDSVNGRVILFGGFDGIVATNDLWAWDSAAGAWTQLLSSGPLPPGREDHSFAFDVARGRAVLHGGWGGVIPVFSATLFSDTWEWDATTQSWSLVTLTAPFASGVTPVTASTWHAARNRVVLFAGSNSTTYDWDGAAWSAIPSPVVPLSTNGHRLAHPRSGTGVTRFAAVLTWFG